MSAKSTVRAALERLLDARIFQTTPRGVDPAADLRGAFPSLAIGTVFDVGANEGQSAEAYLARYPDAYVTCFEPSRMTFDRLQARLAGNPRVRCIRAAVSDRRGTGSFQATGESAGRRLLDGAEGGGQQDTEDVPLLTLDAFCSENGTARIDYLKIDTEGHELEVFGGAAQLLAEERIGILEVELGMNPENTYHTRFEDAKAYLEERGYRLFAIAEQVPEFLTRQPHLRRVNGVFVSAGMIARQSD